MISSSVYPKASVILIASQGRESIMNVMECLQSQSVAKSLEIIIACHIEYENELRQFSQDSFFTIKIMVLDLSTTGWARAEAIKAALAPIILSSEDHAFPIGDRWAERFILAHQSDHAAVGPKICNANPTTVTSWVNLVSDFGPWLSREGPNAMSSLAWHNTSYKRDVLISYGDRLANMLEAERMLHDDLRKDHYTLIFEPSIQVSHLNISKIDKACKVRFISAWMYAAKRARDWPYAKRLFYALAIPAIAYIRFIRLRRHFKNSPEASIHFARCIPAALIYLLIDAIGEGLGYAAGDLNKRSALSRLEYHRWRNIRKHEVKQFYSFSGEA